MAHRHAWTDGRTLSRAGDSDEQRAADRASPWGAPAPPLERARAGVPLRLRPGRPDPSRLGPGTFPGRLHTRRTHRRPAAPAEPAGSRVRARRHSPAQRHSRPRRHPLGPRGHDQNGQAPRTRRGLRRGRDRTAHQPDHRRSGARRRDRTRHGTRLEGACGRLGVARLDEPPAGSVQPPARRTSRRRPGGAGRGVVAHRRPGAGRTSSRPQRPGARHAADRPRFDLSCAAQRAVCGWRSSASSS